MNQLRSRPHWLPRILMGAAVCATFAGCASKDRGKTTTPGLAASQGEAYTSEQVLSMANELVDELEMPAEQQTKVLAKLERVMSEPGFRPQLQERIEAMGVTGVVAYRLGEGGAVVTVKSGKAVGVLKGETAKQWFRLGGADLGPQLAASREWGVFLVLGLPEGQELHGSYRGVQKSASAGRGSGTTEMTAKRGEHRLAFLGAGSGVSLDISGSTLKIKEGKT